MLLELCQGGELFSRLLAENILDEGSCAFDAGNMLLGLQALHNHSAVYRDRKPENILITTSGHTKLADLGFAKKIDGKTFTRCGTPEYVSPETLSHKGHGLATDLWSLGVFVYECLQGTTTFAAKNYRSTYKKIMSYKVHERIRWFSDVSDEAANLIGQLLKPKAKNRPPIEQLKAHPWFATRIDWAGLQAREVEPPFVPHVQDSTDPSLVEPQPEGEGSVIPEEALRGRVGVVQGYLLISLD